VQLSQLDTVQEEELDLEKLVGSDSDNSSSRALEELFEEDLDQDNLDQADLDEPDSDKEVTQQNTEDLTSSAQDPEPLMSRAMANGTIAAAAERMTGAMQRVDKQPNELPDETLPERSGAGPIALVESPHRPTRSKVPAPSAEVSAQKEEEQAYEDDASGSAGASNPAGVWESTEFPETPAESVADITEEMAAAGQAPVVQEPSVFERTKAQLDRFLGHAVALRVATLFAFVVLTGQILYWQFADWSKTDTMRPVYSGLCSVLGCELPLRRSLRDLQSRKLAVRSHPDKEGALLVDALIINEANFEQPFPVIELQFMNMAQDVVGAYRLEPVTYLDGELSGSDALMAIRTPVHIDIDIPDPGPKAVNYQLQFR